MAEPEFRIVITPTRDGFHFKDPEHQAEVIRHLTAEALGQMSAPVQVRVVPAERIEGPSRFTATPAQIDAFLRVHFCEDRIQLYQLYQWAIGDAAAHEAAEEIRAETERLRGHEVLEPDKFRPCRDAADQIDPAKGGGHYPSVLVDFAAAPSGPFRNCYTDEAARKSLTHSPERPCDRAQAHPGHKHLLHRANWYCPGIPVPTATGGE